MATHDENNQTTSNSNNIILHELLSSSRDIRLKIDDIVDKMLHKQDFNDFKENLGIYLTKQEKEIDSNREDSDTKYTELKKDIDENIKPKVIKSDNFFENLVWVLRIAIIAIVGVAVSAGLSFFHISANSNPASGANTTSISAPHNTNSMSNNSRP